MLTVGDTFPAFKLQGVDSNNELVEVSVEENYEPLKKDWSVFISIQKILLLSVQLKLLQWISLLMKLQ